MIDFLKDNLAFIEIVIGFLLFICISYFVYFWNYRKKYPKIKPENTIKSDKSKVVREEPIDLPSQQEEIEEKNLIETETIVPPTMPISKSEGNRNEEFDLVPEENIQDEEQEVKDHDEFEADELEADEKIEEKKSLGRYHVIYRASDTKWIIKREGSEKVIRALPTQKEAIAYATIKALTQDTTYVIHKRDGKIRKMKYPK